MSNPTYHGSSSPLGLTTFTGDFLAFVAISAVFVKTTCHDDVVDSMSVNVNVEISYSILTPGVVTFTTTSILLFPSLISSIASSVSSRKDRVLAPAV